MNPETNTGCTNRVIGICLDIKVSTSIDDCYGWRVCYPLLPIIAHLPDQKRTANVHAGTLSYSAGQRTSHTAHLNPGERSDLVKCYAFSGLLLTTDFCIDNLNLLHISAIAGYFSDSCIHPVELFPRGKSRVAVACGRHVGPPFLVIAKGSLSVFTDARPC